ncbi:MAG: hypothetical protein C3F11_16880 [Methylocystaceae bacterium]|nr:MAG: hypothetical protein C3F11_16880 [Methylocystaceae bacterium]
MRARGDYQPCRREKRRKTGQRRRAGSEPSMSATQTIGRNERRPALQRFLAWTAISIYLALVVAFAWTGSSFAQALAAIGIVSALAHAIATLGQRDALAFFVICLAVTFSIENIGAVTGLPFGHYHFAVGANFPHVGAIPIIVGPLWFGMGYFSWIVAGVLLD